MPSPESNIDSRGPASTLAALIARMKTLHWYLMRQILATLVVTVCVFAGVLLLGSVIKEVLGVLLNQHASFWDIIRAIGMLIPFILVFALPIGMLTAALLVFGRLSADQELTAMRASGVSLLALVSPVLLFSALMCVVCAMVNLDFAPRARQAFKRMIFDMTERNIGLILQPGAFHDFAGYTVYVGKATANELEDVSIYKMEDGKAVQVYRASRATLQVDRTAPENPVLKVGLFDGYMMDFNMELPTYFQELPPIPLPLGKSDQFGEAALANRSIFDLFKERDRLQAIGIDVTPVTFQIHSKIAFSFACVGFTLLGIPLGLQTHRRETRIGLLVALILIAVYYGFFIMGEAWSTRPKLHPWVLVWIPNFLFQGIGAILLYRADRRVS